MNILFVRRESALMGAVEYIFSSNDRVDYVSSSFHVSRILDSLAIAQPDVVILDIKRTNQIWLNAVKQVRAVWPMIKLLVACERPDQNTAIRLVRAGTDGVMTNGSDLGEVLYALNDVMSEGFHLSDDIFPARHPHGSRAQKVRSTRCHTSGESGLKGRDFMDESRSRHKFSAPLRA